MTNEFEFKEAVRERVSVLVGFAGGTGSGKTYSALEFATGLAGGKKFAFIDSEARRGLHYAPRPGEPAKFNFDHLDFAAPFTPERYAMAIAAADAKGYPVVVVDSFSHEWEGEGGMHDMHDAICAAAVERKRQFAISKGWQFDEARTWEAENMSAWIEPKGEHKKMISKLLQLRAHVVLCFRAEDKIEMVKVDNKTVVRPKQSLTGTDGWIPITERRLPFELTASFLLKADHPGVLVPIKLQEQHKPMFPLDKPLTRAAGEAMARWAIGTPVTPSAPSASDLATVVAGFKAATTITALQAAGGAAKGLPDADKGAATVAYKERLEALKAAQPATQDKEPGSEG